MVLDDNTATTFARHFKIRIYTCDQAVVTAQTWDSTMTSNGLFPLQTTALATPGTDLIFTEFETDIETASPWIDCGPRSYQILKLPGETVESYLPTYSAPATLTLLCTDAADADVSDRNLVMKVTFDNWPPTDPTWPIMHQHYFDINIGYCAPTGIFAVSPPYTIPTQRYWLGQPALVVPFTTSDW